MSTPLMKSKGTLHERLQRSRRHRQWGTASSAAGSADASMASGTSNESMGSTQSTAPSTTPSTTPSSSHKDRVKITLAKAMGDKSWPAASNAYNPMPSSESESQPRSAESLTQRRHRVIQQRRRTSPTGVGSRTVRDTVPEGTSAMDEGVANTATVRYRLSQVEQAEPSKLGISSPPTVPLTEKSLSASLSDFNRRDSREQDSVVSVPWPDDATPVLMRSLRHEQDGHSNPPATFARPISQKETWATRSATARAERESNPPAISSQAPSWVQKKQPVVSVPSRDLPSGNPRSPSWQAPVPSQSKSDSASGNSLQPAPWRRSDAGSLRSSPTTPFDEDDVTQPPIVPAANKLQSHISNQKTPPDQKAPQPAWARHVTNGAARTDQTVPATRLSQSNGQASAVAPRDIPPQSDEPSVIISHGAIIETPKAVSVASLRASFSTRGTALSPATPPVPFKNNPSQTPVNRTWNSRKTGTTPSPSVPTRSPSSVVTPVQPSRKADTTPSPSVPTRSPASVPTPVQPKWVRPEQPTKNGSSPISTTSEVSNPPPSAVPSWKKRTTSSATAKDAPLETLETSKLTNDESPLPNTEYQSRQSPAIRVSPSSSTPNQSSWAARGAATSGRLSTGESLQNGSVMVRITPSYTTQHPWKTRATSPTESIDEASVLSTGCTSPTPTPTAQPVWKSPATSLVPSSGRPTIKELWSERQSANTPTSAQAPRSATSWRSRSTNDTPTERTNIPQQNTSEFGEGGSDGKPGQPPQSSDPVSKHVSLPRFLHVSASGNDDSSFDIELTAEDDDARMRLMDASPVKSLAQMAADSVLITDYQQVIAASHAQDLNLDDESYTSSGVGSSIPANMELPESIQSVLDKTSSPESDHSPGEGKLRFISVGSGEGSDEESREMRLAALRARVEIDYSDTYSPTHSRSPMVQGSPVSKARSPRKDSDPYQSRKSDEFSDDRVTFSPRQSSPVFTASPPESPMDGVPSAVLDSIRDLDVDKTRIEGSEAGSSAIFGNPNTFGAAGGDIAAEAPRVLDRAKAIEDWKGGRGRPSERPQDVSALTSLDSPNPSPNSSGTSRAAFSPNSDVSYSDPEMYFDSNELGAFPTADVTHWPEASPPPFRYSASFASPVEGILRHSPPPSTTRKSVRFSDPPAPFPYDDDDYHSDAGDSDHSDDSDPEPLNEKDGAFDYGGPPGMHDQDDTNEEWDEQDLSGPVADESDPPDDVHTLPYWSSPQEAAIDDAAEWIDRDPDLMEVPDESAALEESWLSTSLNDDVDGLDEWHQSSPGSSPSRSEWHQSSPASTPSRSEWNQSSPASSPSRSQRQSSASPSSRSQQSEVQDPFFQQGDPFSQSFSATKNQATFSDAFDPFMQDDETFDFEHAGSDFFSQNAAGNREKDSVIVTLKPPRSSPSNLDRQRRRQVQRPSYGDYYVEQAYTQYAPTTTEWNGSADRLEI